MGIFGLFFFLYPDGDPDDFQNLMGSKLGQDPSFSFIFSEDPTCSICIRESHINHCLSVFKCEQMGKTWIA